MIVDSKFFSFLLFKIGFRPVVCVLEFVVEYSCELGLVSVFLFYYYYYIFILYS